MPIQPASQGDLSAPRDRPPFAAYSPGGLLTFITVTLILLATVPVITNILVRERRQRVTDQANAALVLINDLEAALATEMFGRETPRQAQNTMMQATTAGAHATEISDLSALDSLTRLLGPDAVTRFAELRIAVNDWYRVAGTDTAPAVARAALVAADRLDALLTEHAQAERLVMRRITNFNVVIPVALVPFALLAVMGVVITARYTRRLAEDAQTGRALAEQAMQAKATLIRGITHDIKNPLGALSGYIELLEDGVLGPLQPQQTETIARLGRLVNMTVETVDHLLEVSRGETTAIHIARVQTDIQSLITSLVTDYRASGHNAGLTITEAPDNVICKYTTVETDPRLVREVLGNVISNAIKYTPSGGSIRVSLALISDQAVGPALAVAITDTGPGIDPRYHERVFDEFFRVPETSTGTHGSGVGLAISRQIARTLGGDLRLSSHPGVGSTFTLMLPQPSDISPLV